MTKPRVKRRNSRLLTLMTQQEKSELKRQAKTLHYKSMSAYSHVLIQNGLAEYHNKKGA